MIGWRGPERIVLEKLSRAGADRGDDGRFIVSGEPCQYTLKDAVLHVAVPVSAVFFVRGKRRSFATILEGVASINPLLDKDDVDELLAVLTPAEMACMAKIHRGESVLTRECGDLMWGLEPKGALWTRNQGRQEPWLTGPGKVVAMLADRWEKLPPQSRPLGPQTPGISGEQMTIVTPSLKRLQQRIATALGWSLADVQSMSLPSLREVVGPVSQKLANEITRHISEGAVTRNPETDGWWVAGNRWLQQEALEEYRSQLRAHTKRGRKKSTMRYVVPVWQQEMVAALGRNDEEGFKSLRLHRMNLQWNEEHPLSKRPRTNPMATAQEMLDAIYAWLVKEELTFGVSFVSPEKWRELGWDAELGLPEVTEGFVVVAEGTSLNQALAGYMDHDRAEEKKIYDGWSKVIEAHGWGWQAKTGWAFHVYPSAARMQSGAVPQVSPGGVKTSATATKGRRSRKRESNVKEGAGDAYVARGMYETAILRAWEAIRRRGESPSLYGVHLELPDYNREWIDSVWWELAAAGRLPGTQGAGRS